MTLSELIHANQFKTNIIIKINILVVRLVAGNQEMFCEFRPLYTNKSLLQTALLFIYVFPGA
jgi:hypothetical protein